MSDQLQYCRLVTLRRDEYLPILHAYTTGKPYEGLLLALAQSKGICIRSLRKRCQFGRHLVPKECQAKRALQNLSYPFIVFDAWASKEDVTLANQFRCSKVGEALYTVRSLEFSRRKLVAAIEAAVCTGVNCSSRIPEISICSCEAVNRFQHGGSLRFLVHKTSPSLPFGGAVEEGSPELSSQSHTTCPLARFNEAVSHCCILREESWYRGGYPFRSSSLASVLLSHATNSKCFSGLQMLVSVQQQQQSEPPLHSSLSPSEVNTLNRLSLPELEHSIQHMEHVRASLEGTLASTHQRQDHHDDGRKLPGGMESWCCFLAVCQRYFPLPVVIDAVRLLSPASRSYLRRCQPQAIGNVAYPSQQQQQQLFHAMMFAVAQLYPKWSSIPWLIRCDVLMTYPQASPALQFEMMEDLAARCSSPPPGTEEDSVCGEREAFLNWWRGSHRPTPLSTLLAGIAPKSCMTTIQAASSDAEAAFRRLRHHLEEHKQAGLVRVLHPQTSYALVREHYYQQLVLQQDSHAHTPSD